MQFVKICSKGSTKKKHKQRSVHKNFHLSRSKTLLGIHFFWSIVWHYKLTLSNQYSPSLPTWPSWTTTLRRRPSWSTTRTRPVWGGAARPTGCGWCRPCLAPPRLSSTRRWASTIWGGWCFNIYYHKIVLWNLLLWWRFLKTYNSRRVFFIYFWEGWFLKICYRKIILWDLLLRWKF